MKRNVAIAIASAAIASAATATATATTYGAVMITEVMFASKATEGKSCGDWIELYNPSESEVKIAGWKFSDVSEEKVREDGKKARGHVFVIPATTPPLEPKSFAILSSDEAAFREAYADRPEALDALISGSFKFGLSSKGETISLLSSANETMFSLSYDDKNPWPSTEKGSSLEIIDVRLDPNDALSWIESYEVGGTPGEINSNAISW